MPRIYLSPSTNEFNEYLSGGTEELYMNLIANAMEPFLYENGIVFNRNRPEQTVTEVISDSNAEDYDLHLAIHSSYAPPSASGTLKGANIYYWYESRWGKEAAEIMAENYKKIYPDPQLVNVVPTSTIRELRKTTSPSILIDVVYHDNVEDEIWLKENIEEIGKNLVESLTKYFGIPFKEPS